MTTRPRRLWINLANWNGVEYDEPIALTFDPTHHVWIGAKWHLVIHEDDLVLDKTFINKIYATRMFASFTRKRVVAWGEGVLAMQQVLADLLPERIIKQKKSSIPKTLV